MYSTFAKTRLYKHSIILRIRIKSTSTKATELLIPKIFEGQVSFIFYKTSYMEIFVNGCGISMLKLENIYFISFL